MKRKEQVARSITQDNDAGGHSPRPNGHKARAALKRHASKKLRQALDKEDRNRESCIGCGDYLDKNRVATDEYCSKCIDGGVKL